MSTHNKTINKKLKVLNRVSKIKSLLNIKSLKSHSDRGLILHEVIEELYKNEYRK